MKLIILTGAFLLLACSMPGVGELEERVDVLETSVSYDDSEFTDNFNQLFDDIEDLDGRVAFLETGDISQVTERSVQDRDVSGDIEPSEKIITISDVEGLEDSMNLLTDSMTVIDESLNEVVLSLDSLILENDSLKTELSNLSSEVADLRYTINHLGPSRSSSSGGGTRSGSGSSGTTGTSGSSGTR
jgi:uncharacterized membrane protein YgcG